MIKFNLQQGEVIRKFTFIDSKVSLSHHATFRMLQILDYEGLLPRGYLTRVKNRNIGYHKSLLMCKKLAPQSNYRLQSLQYKQGYLLALVEKNVPVECIGCKGVCEGCYVSSGIIGE